MLPVKYMLYLYTKSRFILTAISKCNTSLISTEKVSHYVIIVITPDIFPLCNNRERILCGTSIVVSIAV